jgi:hypothetical protein
MGMAGKFSHYHLVKVFDLIVAFAVTPLRLL